MNGITNNKWAQLCRRKLESARILAGGPLSRLGEPLGQDWLVYNRWVFLRFDRIGRTPAAVLARRVSQELHPARMLDLGCGTGVYVAEFRALGWDALGFEHNAYARKFGRDRYGLNLAPFDLSAGDIAVPPSELAISIEVAEHLPERLAHRLVDLCCASSNQVIFSAAHPGQPGQGHIFCQPRSYWEHEFELRNFELDRKRTADLTNNLEIAIGASHWLVKNLAWYSRK